MLLIDITSYIFSYNENKCKFILLEFDRKVVKCLRYFDEYILQLMSTSFLMNFKTILMYEKINYLRASILLNHQVLAFQGQDKCFKAVF